MSGLEIHAQGFWAPGFATLGAWLLGEADPSVVKPAASIIPAITRRRTSLLTRAMAEVMGQLLGSADVDGASLPTVFASAHGETSTLGYLLEQLHGPEPGLSPIRFSGSVHNAASGYTSIALGNRRFTTSIAAGEATVAAALLEAQAYLSTTEGCVAVVVGDTAPLQELTRVHERFETFAAGWLLSRPGQSSIPIAQLDGPHRGRACDPSVVAMAAGYTAHPCRPALDLLAAINASGGSVALDRAGQAGWSVDVSRPELS